MGCTSSTAAASSHAVPPLSQKYSLGLLIAEGTFGEVRQVSQSGAKTPSLAVKLLDVSNDELAKKAHDEKYMWLFAGDLPNVLLLVDICYHKSITGKRCLALVSELCQGSLASMELQGSLRAQSRMTSVVEQMCNGVSQLHNVGILHCNIRLENFLLAQDGSIKLCDFSCAIFMSSSFPVRTSTSLSVFIAPEVARGERYGYPADAWSLGVSCHEMLLGKIPLAKSGCACKMLSHGDKQVFQVADVEMVLKQNEGNVLTGLLNMDGGLRWTAERALQEATGQTKPNVAETRMDTWCDYECSTEYGTMPQSESTWGFWGSSWRS